MSKYEERLARDLANIGDRVKEVSETIAKAQRSAVQALLHMDRKRAWRTVLGDLAINREIRAIDRLCHQFVARHLPSAGHLRFVSSVLRLNIALERIGDYAVTIARECTQLSTEPPVAVARDIEMMSGQSIGMLQQAMSAFHEKNADLARGTKGMAQQFGLTFANVFEDLVREAEAGSRPMRDLFALLVVVNRLERVSDQSKNICEETVFVATGKTKSAKVYHVLFIDERNDGLSQLAVAHARKVFPESGMYHSAGWRKADALNPGAVEFAEQRGLPLTDAKPRAMPADQHDLTQYHVIVDLDGSATEHLPKIPFHTIVLEWGITSPPAGTAGSEQFAGAYQEMTAEVRGLLESLRGEEAS